MSLMEDIGGISNPFGSPSSGEWNLSKGSYINSVGSEFVFFVEDRKKENKQLRTAMDQATDTTGRRLAIYEYPYIDGQKISDLGRKGESHTFNIKFHGDQYQTLLRRFEKIIVNDSGTGILNHPTLSAIRGSLKVKYQNHEIIHRYDEFNAVTVRVTFIEDRTGAIALLQLDPPPVDSILKSTLQKVTYVQAFIGDSIFQVGALLTLPGAILNSMKQRLSSITGSVSRLIGQVAATFSPTSSTAAISAQANQAGVPTTSLNSGKSTDGSTLPPVFQSGFDPVTQASINANQASFINANQITSQQAVFAANQARQQISDAIKELESQMGNDAYNMILQYRELAVSLQEMIEVAISSSKIKVKTYVVPGNMSLRMIAKNNGLDPDRQNDIEALNPYLPSVNYIAAGSKVLVPES